MALFKNSYSGLITKGLGMPACCGLITMGFGLFFCKIEVIEPPPEGGSGGGSFATHPGIMVPFRTKIQQKTKNVQITVKFSKKQAWRRSYVVTTRKADIVVKVINIVNAVTSKLTVGIDRVRQATKRVTAVFNK